MTGDGGYGVASAAGQWGRTTRKQGKLSTKAVDNFRRPMRLKASELEKSRGCQRRLELGKK